MHNANFRFCHIKVDFHLSFLSTGTGYKGKSGQVRREKLISTQNVHGKYFEKNCDEIWQL